MRDFLLRREFLRRVGSVAGACCLGAAAWRDVLAQSSAADQVHDLRGDVRLNGRPYARGTAIRTGDTIATGSDGYIVFTMERDAFLLRSRSELQLEGAVRTSVVSALRLVTGALGAAFGKAGRRTVHGPTVTAGIRGTGIYAETRGLGTYFCTCYGTVELESLGPAPSRLLIESTRHSSPQMVMAPSTSADIYAPAQFETHTDAEMDMLEKCVGRRAPWIRN